MATKISSTYIPGKGVLVTVYAEEGYNFLIPDDWTVAKIERHLKELRDFLNY